MSNDIAHIQAIALSKNPIVLNLEIAYNLVIQKDPVIGAEIRQAP
jgi:hypothetical protein